MREGRPPTPELEGAGRLVGGSAGGLCADDGGVLGTEERACFALFALTMGWRGQGHVGDRFPCWQARADGWPPTEGTV